MPTPDRARLAGAALCALVSIAVRAPDAAAQTTSTWSYRAEAFGAVGYGHLSSGSEEYASGLDAGAGAAIRPFRSGRAAGVGFEVRALFLRSGDEPPVSVGSSEQMTATQITASVLYHFRTGTRVQPFVQGGLAVVATDYRFACRACVGDPDPRTGAIVWRDQDERSTDTKAGYVIGGGTRVGLNRHLWLRPDVSIIGTTAGSGLNWAWVQAQVGLAVAF